VVDVLRIRQKRLLLVTDKHVALVSVKIAGPRSTYKAKWSIQVAEVQNVRGAPCLFWRSQLSLSTFRRYIMAPRLLPLL
jgi:hypothetical protein